MSRTRSPRTAGRLAPVVASALTILAMAVVAAGRGSPYQPILPPGAEPSGWLRDLARAVGLGSIHGNALLAVSVVVAGAAVLASLWLLRETWRGHVATPAVAVVVVAAHLVVLALPLLFSRDVYSYAFYGRIDAVHGANPYLDTPLDHSGDELWRYVGPKWVDTPAVYGPAWTAVSSWVARRAVTPADHVDAYRAIAVAASLATSAAIAWSARRLAPGRTAFALAAFGANPVVLFHAVASGHNDLAVALSIAVGLGLVVSGRSTAAVVTLALGALVKATAALPLLLLLVWLVGREPPGRRRRALLVHGGPAVVVALVVAAPYLQPHDPTLGMLELATHEGWLAPSAVIGRLLNVLTFDTLGWLVRLVFGVVLLVAVVGTAREVWRRASSGDPLAVPGLAAAWGWVLVLFALLSPVLLPWYVVWALPLVWLLPRAARAALLASSALLAVTLWSAEPLRFPGAFDVNLFVGSWIVTPILLALALRALRDLRARVDLGMPFEDPVPAPAGRHRADDQERVAAPTGHG
ncbi:MAG TPA: hypothetical protein VF044_07780 [Actinomycetota bacterium]